MLPEPRSPRKDLPVNTVLVCLLVAVLLPYVLAGIGGYHKGKQFGKVDNNNPRAQAAQLTGAGARAVAAQQNAWEALAVFTASLAAAFFAGVAPESIALPALLFVAARIAHAACYLADLATARSTSFLVATAMCLWIFGKALAA
jgi:uncharacterized MAPEG superfamily protein